MALSLLDSTSKLLQQLDLLDREPVLRNMEGLMADELMDVPDTPDRLDGLGKTGCGSASSVIEKVDDVRHACRKDNKKFKEEVRASVNPNAEKASCFSLSKEIPRRRRSNWSSKTNEGRWPSVSLGEGQGPSYYQHKNAVNNIEDNIEAETLVHHACTSEDFDNLDRTFPIPESACSDNLFSRNSGHAKITMGNDPEFCSRFQSKGSRTFNRRGRLSLQNKKILEVDTGPLLLSHGQTNQQPAVPGTSSNPDASCFSKPQSMGSGSSLWSAGPVSGSNQSGNSFDSKVQHQADNILPSDSKVEGFGKGDTDGLSTAGFCRKNQSSFKYPAISRGRSALGKCNFNNSQEASSDTISAKFNPKENEISSGASAAHGKSDIIHDFGPLDNLTGRIKIDLESASSIRSTRDAEAKKYQLSGRMGSWNYKLDNIAPKGTKDEKNQDGIARHIDHRTADMDRKSSKDVKKTELHGESLPHHKVIEVSSLHSTIVPRQTRGRRLVRNGCISPLNIARMNRVSSDGNKNVIENMQSVSEDMDIHENNAIKQSSELQKVEKKKGKEVMIDSIMVDASPASERHLDRQEIALSQEPTDNLRMCGIHDGLMEDSWDWGGANCSSHEVLLSPSGKKDEVILGSSNDAHEKVLHGRENLNTVVHLDNSSNDTCTSGLSESRIALPPVQATSTTLFDTQPNNERKSRGGRIVMKRQRRSSSIADNHWYGEGSSTSYVGPAVARMQSSRQPSPVSSTRRSRTHQAGSILGNVIEIDDSSSPRINSHSREVNANCAAEDDAGAKARQVEADELLARQLQEQFYREVVGAGNNEIDANIAWTLQEEEISRNAPATSSINGDLPFHPRISTATDFNRPFLLRSSENSSVWATTRPVTSSSRLAQLRRSIHYRSSTPHSGRRLRFPSNMSLETRIQLLEALDGIVGSDGSFAADRFLTTERDFNENDYEMLLALDNDNDRHTGASAEQINRLPLSQVQVDNSGEACAVCLETPSVGEQIRHLPCLHKFHKECIDPWLRRRASCPICKSSISGC
ncbi:uncharacterized protein LOC116252779 isoform X2 [Nymphaea colorata]|nr:uncharacterized protein LOC116252779 isoform X2 [Nymphaea colorata]